jgi:hypothetical protein
MLRRRRWKEEDVIDGLLIDALLKEMECLSPVMQRRVVDFARASAESKPRGAPGNELLQFAGIMTPAEADEFLRGIEEDCEREEPISVVRGMIGWIYENPHAYARTVGEIDSILYCLHFLWDKCWVSEHNTNGFVQGWIPPREREPQVLATRNAPNLLAWAATTCCLPFLHIGRRSTSYSNKHWHRPAFGRWSQCHLGSAAQLPSRNTRS